MNQSSFVLWLFSGYALLCLGCGASPATNSPPVANSTPPSESAKTNTPSAASPAVSEPEVAKKSVIAEPTPSVSKPVETKSTTPPAKVEPSANTTPPVRKPHATPATQAEAAKVLDWRTFPHYSTSENPRSLTLAEASFAAAGTPQKAYEHYQQKLTAAGWKELPNSYSSAESCSASFVKDGFRVSFASFNNPSPGSKGNVSIMLTNHGNIDLQTLPTPDNVKPLYVSPQGAMYVSEASVAAATEEVRKLFLSLGWEPYGGAPECLDFRKNAVLLTARISSAPAQEGKTVIDYHTVLLAHDFPLPPDAVGIQYSNTPAQVLFDVKVSQEELAKFYRETLTKSGWKATTDNLVTVDRKQLQIFRNEQKDLMELEMTTVDDLTRAELHFQSAAEVEAEEKAFQAEKAKRLAEANKPKPTFKFSLPADAKNVEAEKTRVKFNLPVGTALATTEALKKQFEADGWKAEIAKLEAMFGVLELKKGEQTLTLNFLETGILAPEVTISSFGVDLEVAAIK